MKTRTQVEINQEDGGIARWFLTDLEGKTRYFNRFPGHTATWQLIED